MCSVSKIEKRKRGINENHILFYFFPWCFSYWHIKDDVPGKVDEKATQLHAIASLKVLLDATKPQSGSATTSAANHVKINLKETTLACDRPNGNIDTTLDSVSILKLFFSVHPSLLVYFIPDFYFLQQMKHLVVTLLWCALFNVLCVSSVPYVSP